MDSFSKEHKFSSKQKYVFKQAKPCHMLPVWHKIKIEESLTSTQQAGQQGQLCQAGVKLVQFSCCGKWKLFFYPAGHTFQLARFAD